MKPLFTVGHSNHTPDAFVALLRRHAITAVADVRSSPYSRYNPQFNRDALAATLEAVDIRYAFLGVELGARRDEAECYDGPTARYDLIATAPKFRRGLDRIRQGVESYRVALLCAEKDPLTCHRAILVCRHLRDDISDIRHIREDGTLETHAALESRLLAECGFDGGDLFHSRADNIERAYDTQGERIAYVARSEEVAGDAP